MRHILKEYKRQRKNNVCPNKHSIWQNGFSFSLTINYRANFPVQAQFVFLLCAIRVKKRNKSFDFFQILKTFKSHLFLFLCPLLYCFMWMAINENKKWTKLIPGKCCCKKRCASKYKRKEKEKIMRKKDVKLKRIIQYATAQQKKRTHFEN